MDKTAFPIHSSANYKGKQPLAGTNHVIYKRAQFKISQGRAMAPFSPFRHFAIVSSIFLFQKYQFVD